MEIQGGGPWFFWQILLRGVLGVVRKSVGGHFYCIFMWKFSKICIGGTWGAPLPPLPPCVHLWCNNWRNAPMGTSWVLLNQIMDNGINRWKGLNLSLIDKSSNSLSHQMYVNFIRLLLSIGYCNEIRLAQNDPIIRHINNYISTVKPVLTATSEQRPPANNGQPKPGQIKFNSNFDWKISKIGHLCITATILGSQGWQLLQIGIAFKKCFYLVCPILHYFHVSNS